MHTSALSAHVRKLGRGLHATLLSQTRRRFTPFWVMRCPCSLSLVVFSITFSIRPLALVFSIEASSLRRTVRALAFGGDALHSVAGKTLNVRRAEPRVKSHQYRNKGTISSLKCLAFRSMMAWCVLYFVPFMTSVSLLASLPFGYQLLLYYFAYH